MTYFGKTLVRLNLFFSLGLMSWALLLLCNRIDWPAELAKRLARIDEILGTSSQVGSIRTAEAAWSPLPQRIAALEKQRIADRAWYAAELRHIRSGADAANPVRSLVFERGIPALDAANQNRPKLEPAKDRKDQPLQSIAFYENELKGVRESLAAELDKYNEQVVEDTRLTNLLAGEGMKKGLRQRINDERDKIQDLLKEHDLTRPMLINAYVESQLVFKRAEALKSRIEELQKLNTAAATAGQ